MQPDTNDISFIQYGFSVDFLKRVYEMFGGSGADIDSIFRFIQTFWTVYSVFAFILSALFIYGIIYSFIRMNQLSEIESQGLAEAERLWKEAHGQNVGNQRWKDVQAHLSSTNPNDWKLAIIEADVMLERMLENAGFAGNTIADRLRSASTRSFSTLDDAWQAHRVRNQIAHGGSDFVLTQRVARETLVQYEKVFREFSII